MSQLETHFRTRSIKKKTESFGFKVSYCTVNIPDAQKFWMVLFCAYSFVLKLFRPNYFFACNVRDSSIWTFGNFTLKYMTVSMSFPPETVSFFDKVSPVIAPLKFC